MKEKAVVLSIYEFIRRFNTDKEMLKFFSLLAFFRFFFLRPHNREFS